MTWEGELTEVRNPIINNWDFASAPVAWPGQEFDPPAKTGDRSDPAVWVDFQLERRGSSFLATNGSNARRVSGAIICGVVVEPIIGHDLIHRQKADLLYTYYSTASDDSIFFYVLQVTINGPYLWESDWQRMDWICPYDAYRAL